MLAVSTTDSSRFADGATDNITLRGVSMFGDCSDTHWDSHVHWEHSAVLGDYQEVKAAGANMVRVEFGYSQYTVDPAAFWAFIDSQVSYAKSVGGIYLILSCVTLPGPQGSGDPHPGALDYYEGYTQTPGDFYTNSTKRGNYGAMWTAIAARYKAEAVIGGYDLINEPNPPYGTAQNNLFADLQTWINAVRFTTDQHVVFVQSSPSYKNYYPGNVVGTALTDPTAGQHNIAYVVHTYHPNGFCFSASPQTWPYNDGLVTWDKARVIDDFTIPKWDSNHDTYQVQRNFAIAQNSPLWVGEFGASPFNAESENAKYVADVTGALEELGLHWSYFGFRPDGDTMCWYPSWTPDDFSSPHTGLMDALTTAYAPNGTSYASSTVNVKEGGVWKGLAASAAVGGSGTVVIRDSHTFALQGAVTTAPVPGLFVDLASDEAVSLVKCRAMTGAGSVTFKLQRNGADVGGFGTTGSPLTATSTPSTIAPSAVSLVADDLLQLVIVGVTGSPTDLAVSVVLERTI